MWSACAHPEGQRCSRRNLSLKVIKLCQARTSACHSASGHCFRQQGATRLNVIEATRSGIGEAHPRSRPRPVGSRLPRGKSAACAIHRSSTRWSVETGPALAGRPGTPSRPAANRCLEPCESVGLRDLCPKQNRLSTPTGSRRSRCGQGRIRTTEG